MSSREKGVKWCILFNAVIILLVIFSVLLFSLPPGMEPAAALLLISPFAMCILVSEAATLLGESLSNE